MSHEHYSTLGISQNATEDEIKKAYRKKAMELHPDRHGGDKAKEAEFKKVAAAYQTLSDSTKKTNYDRYGTDDVGGGSGGFGGFQDMGDMSDIFSSFFGGQRGSTSRRRADIGEDIQVRMSISLEDAIRGTKKSIDYKKKVVCTVCNGTGAKVGTTPDTCATCRGSGQVRERVQTIFGTMEQQGTCRTCGGTGSVVHEKCDACTGGYVVQKTTQTIDIPAGIEDGMSIKMRNEWNMWKDSNGDLYIEFSVPTREAGLEREWNDLHFTVSIPVYTAVLGGDIAVDIPILGRKNIKIHAGTLHGKEIPYIWEGIARIDRKGMHGDLILHIAIDIPQKVSGDEKKIYETLRDIHGGKQVQKGFWESILG